MSMIAEPLLCTASKGFTFCNVNSRNGLDQNESGFTSQPARCMYLRFHNTTNKLDKDRARGQNHYAYMNWCK